METTSCIGIMAKRTETTTACWGYIGIVIKKMDETILTGPWN